MDIDEYDVDVYDPWDTEIISGKIVDRLVNKYLDAYRYLENLARSSGEPVPAKTVQDLLMSIFRWELIERFRLPFSIDGPNAVILYQPFVYKVGKYVPFVGGIANRFFQNSLILIFDKFRYDNRDFDDAYYFKIVDFMKRLADYKDNINKSYLRSFVFNNTIAYVEYKEKLFGRDGYFVPYFRPLKPDRHSVSIAMTDLYRNIAELAGRD
jgi:hypothetical protein